MIDFVTRYLHWRAFALGVLLALTSASVMGLLLTRGNDFPDFVRMFRPITPETLYYPTARQIAALVDDRAPPDKIAVLIGGSSVLRGVSQRESHVWSLALQDALGPSYRVINLAMNGGGTVGMASYMTEMLTKAGRRAILLGDMLPGTWIPDSPNPFYRYFYFEAEDRGYLYSSEPRSAYLSGEMDDARIALKIRAAANTVLNYEELWQHIAACCVFTVYNSLMVEAPWGPRGGLPDDEVPLVGYSMDTLPADRNAAEMRIVRGYATAVVNCPAETRGLGIAFPAQIKDRVILVVTGQAPFYMLQLEPDERIAVNQFHQDWSGCIAADGITPAFADRVLDDADHYDRVHLTERGGEALAAFLAPIVRNKAIELGFVQ